MHGIHPNQSLSLTDIDSVYINQQVRHWNATNLPTKIILNTSQIEVIANINMLYYDLPVHNNKVR